MNIFVDNYLYDNDSYASDADWKIGKKPETDLKNRVLNIDVDDNEIHDLNNEDTVHLKYGLADENNTYIKDNEI